MIRQGFCALLLGGVLLVGLAELGWGLQIRTYSAARHDRFTGYPAAPVWNATAWFGSNGYAGVGWAPADANTQRQFALVSPLHLVCATHFQPNVGQVIRFLNSSGITVERTVAALTPIKNELGQNSDLTLATLSAPLLAADQVAPFPYLNRATEADYLNTALVVFGWHVRAGKGKLAAFSDLVEPGVNSTRAMRFDYFKLFGNQDDTYLEIGDSGSPTFALVGGRPAVVGIHLSVGEDAIKYYSFDTFIPHYSGALNAVMAPTGYQMTPAFPPAVSLTATQTITPTTWRQANPGSCRFEVTNPSANTATNVAVVLRFPPTAAPTTVTAPGWIVTPAGGGEWVLRRATLAASATVAITAEWLDLGLSTSLNTELVLVSDGSAQQRFEFRQSLAPSYNAWASGLADPAPGADPDGDGVVNLQEYSFGGDPAANSRTRASGSALLPWLRVAGGLATLEFPVRDDAAARGLSYIVEFSETLAANSWTRTPPPGTTVADAPYSPAEAGWLRRSVTYETAATRRFCRVRLELNESP